jgi:hypothetical protein
METVRDIAFCDRLAERFPEVGVLLAEHRREYGETLPHVFMADVARWFVDQSLSTRTGRAKALAGWFDDEYQSLTPYSQNVIDVSLLENLPWPPDPKAPRNRTSTRPPAPTDPERSAGLAS